MVVVHSGVCFDIYVPSCSFYARHHAWADSDLVCIQKARYTVPRRMRIGQVTSSMKRPNEYAAVAVSSFST